MTDLKNVTYGLYYGTTLDEMYESKLPNWILFLVCDGR